ncbi:MAG: COX15/CtaA family protein [Chloroflexota bacterium]
MSIRRRFGFETADVRRWVRPLADVAALGMFLVVLMGATVTDTGSAAGCGRSWPLCHGQFIPRFAIATLIEFSHRLVTGLEGMLIFALTVAVLLIWKRRDMRVLAAAMLITLFLQSGMGAAAVMWPQSPAVLALHLGISLIAFASVALTALSIRYDGDLRRLRREATSAGFRLAVWGVTIYTYLAVYSGAYVRHAGASLACLDWPSCNGATWLAFGGLTGVVVIHRIVAFGVFLVVLGLAGWSYRLKQTRPDLYRGSVTALALVVLQGLAGGLIVLTRVDLLTTLAHTGIVALLFASLCFLCRQTLVGDDVKEAERSTAPIRPVSDVQSGDLIRQ